MPHLVAATLPNDSAFALPQPLPSDRACHASMQRLWHAELNGGWGARSWLRTAQRRPGSWPLRCWTTAWSRCRRRCPRARLRLPVRMT